MTIDPLLPWLTAINSLIALGSFIYAWLTARAKGNSEKLAAVEKIVIEHDRRIQEIEGELRHLPDKDSVVDLKISMAKIEGAVSALTERLGGMGATVTRIDDYLRTKGEH
ncbi:MAG: hypothetical protein CML23_06685 [Rhizobiaceae bacterium]|nr:hypothetical protein [Rhizobiaceae bacterium]